MLLLPPRVMTSRIVIAATLTGLAPLVGCAVGANYHRRKAPDGAAYAPTLRQAEKPALRLLLMGRHDDGITFPGSAQPEGGSR